MIIRVKAILKLWEPMVKVFGIQSSSKTSKMSAQTNQIKCLMLKELIANIKETHILLSMASVITLSCMREFKIDHVTTARIQDS